MPNLEVPSVERIIELLEEVVAEYGSDYVYINPDGEFARNSNVNCYYVHPDSNDGCIAGQVFKKLGVPIEFLRTQELTTASAVFMSYYFNGASLAEPVPAAMVLRAAQFTQDLGKTWGEALEAAKEEARRYVDA